MESELVHPARPSATADDGRTRQRVTALLLEHGPQTAAELAGRLGVSPSAVRRHLDALVATGRVEERQATGAQRGRGRPARRFHLTDAGRSTFPHAYDDLALTALRHIAASQGPDAVRAVAEAQLAGLEQRCSAAVDEAASAAPPAAQDRAIHRAQALAGALTAEGYAAAASVIASGGQLCQHHCPVAHVAAEFPQLCEAETAVIGRLVGTHVQRLATIAHGDGVCTTHIPGPTRSTDLPHTRAGNRSTPARPVPGERAARHPRTAPSTSTPSSDRERTPA
ncbi:helix-turn-helix transcriptional regulator [Blastococcus sp. SYSU D00820]